MPELADGIVQTVEAIKSQKKCQVYPKMAEDLTPADKLKQAIESDIQQLCSSKKAGSEKVFAILEYLVTEERTLVYLLCLQDDDEHILVHLSNNCEPENSQCLEYLNSSLKAGLGKQPEVFYEQPRHQFAFNNIDIFAYVWLINVYELGLPAREALMCLLYNEVAFVVELMRGLEEGGEEGDMLDNE